MKILRAAIKDVQTHTVMDFWDTLYGVVIMMLSLFQPVLILLAVACLWCGYGKEIKILTGNGPVVKIPFMGSKEQVNRFKRILNLEN